MKIGKRIIPMFLGMMTYINTGFAKEITIQATDDQVINIGRLITALEENQDTTETVIINLGRGIYHDPSITVVPTNASIILKDPIPHIVKDLDKDMPTTGVIIKTALLLKGYNATQSPKQIIETGVDNLVFQRRNPDTQGSTVRIMGGRVNVKNCFFIDDYVEGQPYDGYRMGLSLEYNPGSDGGITAEGNYFIAHAGGGMHTVVNNSTATNIKIRNNIFYKNRQGMWGSSDTDMGTLTEPGNNLFQSYMYNMVIERGTNFPSIYNYWYTADISSITTEEGIYATLLDRRTSSSSLQSITGVTVSPFHIGHPLLNTVTGVSNWWRYE